jgi:hypothetical protein
MRNFERFFQYPTDQGVVTVSFETPLQQSYIERYPLYYDKGQKMNAKTNMTKRVPAYVILAVIVAAIMLQAVVYAAISSASTRTVTTIGGEVFTLTEQLTLTPQGIGISTATASAAGSSLANNVTMTASGASANTALTQGNFEYRLEVAIATVSTAQAYSVQLLEDGTSKGTVYIGQASSGAAQNDYVTIKFDLGQSLSSAVYEIQVLPQP